MRTARSFWVMSPRRTSTVSMSTSLIERAKASTAGAERGGGFSARSTRSDAARTRESEMRPASAAARSRCPPTSRNSRVNASLRYSEAAEVHVAGEESGRVLDLQRAAARDDRAPERPAQAVVGAEQPCQADRRSGRDQADEGCAEKEARLTRLFAMVRN
jgi:hypothetical protein